MADEILSSEELESLLSSVEDSSTNRRDRPKRITEYDFIRPNKLSGEQLRSLQRLHESIAQNMTMTLSTYLRINLEVNIVSLGELTFEVFRNSLPNPTVINVISLDPLPERALATMDMKLSFSLLDRMLGGLGKPLDRLRPLTTIEQSLLDNVIRRGLDQFSEGWKELAAFTAVVESREMDPQFVQVIPSSEMVLVSTFSISAPGELEPGELCFCIPFISLDSVLPRLGNQFRFASMQRDQSSAQRKYLDRVVNDSPLPVTTDLGTTTLTVDEIMNLKVGDVLVMDQRPEDQAKGFVSGRLRMLGRPGQIGRKAGFLVEQVLPDGRIPR